ncbi:MAG: spermidine synthase, partial [Anaerolineae bacterium]|nr:spermidine synthase [Anaerolineae bacterium]
MAVLGRSGSSGSLGLPLLAVVFASGASALVYQVVWQRVLGFFTGAEVRSVTLITASFLLGLGVGTALGGRLCARFSPRQAMRAYALANWLIMLLGATSHYFYYEIIFLRLNTLSESPAGLLGVVFLSLLLPTSLMGLSLPLLTRALVRDIEETPALVTLLNGTNLLGAGVGTLVAGWLLVWLVGFDGAAMVAPP